MKKISLFLMLMSAICSPGWSHEAPVPVNQMQWVVDAGVLHVHFHAKASWWVLNVFGEQTPPPLNWPNSLRDDAKTYFDQHFILRADGKILPSKLLFCRYSEEVWRYYLGSQMDLEFSYALPSAVQTISGQATFYKEDIDGLHETHIAIDGAPAQAITLTLAHTEFSFAFQNIVRSSVRRWWDACLEGLGFWKIMPWVVLAFAAFQMQLRTRVKRTTYDGGFIIATAACAIFLNTHRAMNSGYGTGVFIALLAIAVAIEAGLRIYRLRLVRASESQADALFTSQIRFVSLLLGGMTLLLMAQYFQKSL